MIARTLSITAAIIAAYVAVPLIVGDSHYIMSLITASLVVGGVALAWALLGNLGGMVSFGHSAFFGVGAYVSAILTMKAGVPVLAAMLLMQARRRSQIATLVLCGLALIPVLAIGAD